MNRRLRRVTRKRRRRRGRRDGGGSWNGMNSHGTRSGASGRQLRKTVQGESSEITGGDDSIAPIGNDGADTASCGNIRREMETRELFRVPFNEFLFFFFFLFSPAARSIFYSSCREERSMLDEFIYEGYIILIWNNHFASFVISSIVNFNFIRCLI